MGTTRYRSFFDRKNASTSATARWLFACADLLLAARTSFNSASWFLCKYLIKALVPCCGCTEDTPCRLCDAGSILRSCLIQSGRIRR